MPDPRFVVTTALVMLAAPGAHVARCSSDRDRRIVASAHWTLAIYSSTGPSQQYMPSSAALRDAGLAIIGSGLIAGALLLLLELLAERMGPSRRGHFSRRIGQGMLAALTTAAVVIGVAAHGTTATSGATSHT